MSSIQSDAFQRYGKWMRSRRAVLHDRSLQQLMMASTASELGFLWKLAAWNAGAAARALLEGRTSGWRQMDLALAYSRCFLASSEIRLQQNRRAVLGVPAADLSLWGMHALAVGHDEYAHEIWESWLSPHGKILSGERDDPIVRFTIWVLLRCELGVAGQVDVSSLGGPYGAVIAAWPDPYLVSSALRGLCEFHLRQARDPSGERLDFQLPGYEYFPVEVLAVNRAMGVAGFDAPVLDHPLMQTPLASPPEFEAPVSPELSRAWNIVRAGG